MMQGDDVKILYLALGIMFIILFFLLALLFLFKAKERRESKKNSQNQDENISGKTKVQENYNLKSVFSFMEFDKIQDNMIVQKNGQRFLMIIKCQGINYDLMSGLEKTAVEQGFVQFLNTLRYPIQLYIQTRTVDLGDSISTYREKVKDLANNLSKKEFEYNQKVRSGRYEGNELDREKFELIKARNLYEYGADIITNTERMSLNRNILSKQYYIIIPYYPEELNSGNYAKEEISNAAFSELYTRAQSTINLLSVCGINGKILDSFEIAELLYRAYNRDESEIYDLRKALNSGFDEMYITAPNVLDKRMEELDKRIEQEAIAKANEAAFQAREESEKEKKLKKKEKEFSDLIAKMSKIILDNNRGILGKEIVDKAKVKIDNDSVEKEVSDEKKDIKKSGRPRKLA